jgi:hypothetical protein
MKSSEWSKVFLPLLSLFLTIIILYFLTLAVQRLTAGDHSAATITEIICLCMSLLFLPFFFTRRKKDKKKSKTQPIIPEKKKFNFRFIRKIRLNTHFEFTPIAICPYCKKENPVKSKICLNCGRLTSSKDSNLTQNEKIFKF